jgi:hypothetical protein
MFPASSPIGAGPPSRGGSELIYLDGLVAISRTVVVIRGTTYPTQGIASVRVAARRRILGFVIASVICGASGVLTFREDADVAAVWLFALCATLAMIAYANASRPLYSLLLRTTGGETPAFVSADAEYIAHLRSCIRSVIAEHVRAPEAASGRQSRPAGTVPPAASEDVAGRARAHRTGRRGRADPGIDLTPSRRPGAHRSPSTTPSG